MSNLVLQKDWIASRRSRTAVPNIYGGARGLPPQPETSMAHWARASPERVTDRRNRSQALVRPPIPERRRAVVVPCHDGARVGSKYPYDWTWPFFLRSMKCCLLRARDMIFCLGRARIRLIENFWKPRSEEKIAGSCVLTARAGKRAPSNYPGLSPGPRGVARTRDERNARSFGRNSDGIARAAVVCRP